MKVYSLKASKKSPPDFVELISGNTLLETSYKNGVITCSFERTISVPDSSKDYMYGLESNGYLAVASGPLLTSGSPKYHFTLRSITKEPIDIREFPKVLTTSKEFYKFVHVFLYQLYFISNTKLKFVNKDKATVNQKLSEPDLEEQQNSRRRSLAKHNDVILIECFVHRSSPYILLPFWISQAKVI